MNVKEYLTEVADVMEGTYFDDNTKLNTYISKHDKSYITLVGLEDNVKHLAELGITEQLSKDTGFSPLHNKWYGWSHRAIYGFTIGSTCKKGDVHYRPKTKEQFMEAQVEFWTDDKTVNVKAEERDDDIIYISWDYIDGGEGKISGIEQKYSPLFLGKGEWTAETMEDAKQMAIDFAQSVS